MSIATALIAFALLAPAAAAAQEADPMRSAPCLAARAELDTLLAQPRAGGEPLDEARRRAAQACLGASDGARQRSGAPEPPQAVAPTLVFPRPAVQPQPPAPAPPPLSVPRPTAITTCDPGGCWDSDGRRLNQMGPLLVGPGGVCSGLGGVLTCP